jgi:outer membrane immunogenic protein
MHKLALTSFVVLVCSVFAFAGPEAIRSSDKEMKQTVAPVSSCDLSWTGFYVGVHAGYGWTNGDVNFDPVPDAQTFSDLAPTSLDPSPAGFIGGGQIGYNYQFGRFVVGAEADFSGTTLDGTTTRSPVISFSGADEGPNSELRTHRDVNWTGTARLRLGFAPVCRLLLYGTGGLAYGDVGFSADTDYRLSGGNHFPAQRSETEVGWAAGGGAEFAFTKHWSIKVEYLYRDLGDESITAHAVPSSSAPSTDGVRYSWETQLHSVTAGLNFKF